jgi:hypothetical protein
MRDDATALAPATDVATATLARVQHRRFPGTLNLFQRMMLRWRDLHPYNAVHVAFVARELDASRLQRMASGVLEAAGLAGYALDRRRRRFAFAGGAVSADVAVVAAGDPGDIDAVLTETIERELNTPFAIGAPLRFFAIGAAGGFHLGLAYDHFIAGGDSAATLLGVVAARYLDVAVDDAAARPPLYPPTYAALARRHPGWFGRALAHLPALAAQAKRAWRCRDADPDDPRNAFAILRVDAASTAAFRARAKANDVTLHDLLIAASLKALSAFAAARTSERERREISVASIVNIRRDFGGAADAAFGQFLASMRIAHPVPDGIGVDALARDVRTATLPIKRQRLYIATLCALQFAARAWKYMSPAQRRRFFAKHHPACAGVSMLGVDASWPPALRPASGYLRGVSTGPLTPAVLAVSVTAAEVTIGVSWRPTVLPAGFVERLRAELAACAKVPGC